MVEADRPLLNRGSLGAAPVLDESAMNRILAAFGGDLLPTFPQSAFARFLNDAAQMALDRSFSTKPASRQIQQFKASYKSLLARSHELQRMGVAVPMPPDRWRDHAEKFIDDWENAARGRHGHALGDLQFCGSLIGLFHAATGLKPTATTSENGPNTAGTLAKFVLATLIEIRSFYEAHTLDPALVNELNVQRFKAIPTGGALRKQLQHGRDQSDWIIRARFYREMVGSTENQ
ncbi:MAG: hypothetical protein ACFB2Z_08845 [Maricaulaceae bacterium]